MEARRGGYSRQGPGFALDNGNGTYLPPQQVGHVTLMDFRLNSLAEEHRVIPATGIRSAHDARGVCT